MSQSFVAFGSFLLLFFLLFEVLDYLVDNGILLLGSHARETQQRVLQSHVLRIHGEFVEHIAALFEEFVVGIFLIEQRYCFGEARLRQVVLMAGKINVAQSDLAYGFIYAVAGAFLSGEHIVGNGLGGVAAREIEVAYGIVYLVEIFAVAVEASHAF